MKIIGLTGEAGSGKDTIADYLVEHHDFRKISFAEPLRRGLQAMFGIPMHMLQDRAIKHVPLNVLGGKSIREAMNTLGTEWGRECVADDIWLTTAGMKLNQLRAQSSIGHVNVKGIVISDVRFSNERGWLYEQGGELWHVKRPGNPYALPPESHVSQQGLPVWDGNPVITNDGDIEFLHNRILRILEADKDVW